MLRNAVIAFLCRLAGHPQEPLTCNGHYSSVILAWSCVCGVRYRFDR